MPRSLLLACLLTACEGYSMSRSVQDIACRLSCLKMGRRLFVRRPIGTQSGLTIHSIPWNDCVYEYAPGNSYMIFFRSTNLAILLIAAALAAATPTQLSGSPAYDQWPVNWEAY